MTDTPTPEQAAERMEHHVLCSFWTAPAAGCRMCMRLRHAEEIASLTAEIDALRADRDRMREASFQSRVDAWVTHCFGETIRGDKMERNHRFIEEALELVQSGGCTADEAHQLVDYVFERPVGEMAQEVGGVMNTLAAFCNIHEINLTDAAENELRRVWAKSDQIRAKQAAKPKHSPLPAARAALAPAPEGGA